MVLETELKVPHQTCFGGDRIPSTPEILGKQGHMGINSVEFPLWDTRDRGEDQGTPYPTVEIRKGEADLVILGSFSLQPYESL